MEKKVYMYPDNLYEVWIKDSYFYFPEGGGSCKEPDKIITYSDLNPIDLIEYLENKNYILLSDEEENKHRIMPTKEIVDICEIKSKLKGERKYRYDGVKKYKPEIDDYIFSYKLIIK